MRTKVGRYGLSLKYSHRIVYWGLAATDGTVGKGLGPKGSDLDLPWWMQAVSIMREAEKQEAGPD